MALEEETEKAATTFSARWPGFPSGLVREARRAYRTFHAQCFWSYALDLDIGAADVNWVAERLMKYGGCKAWEKGAQLCR